MNDEEYLVNYCNTVAQLSFKKRNLVISTSPERGSLFNEAVSVELKTRKLRKRKPSKENLSGG